MSHPKPTLPLELVHKIIIYVIAEGVHTICTSDTFSELDDDPEDSDIPDGRDPDVFYWEIHALSTLSAVCWQFKDACMDIAIKTFGAEMPESEDEARYAAPLQSMLSGHRKLACISQSYSTGHPKAHHSTLHCTQSQARIRVGQNANPELLVPLFLHPLHLPSPCPAYRSPCLHRKTQNWHDPS